MVLAMLIHHILTTKFLKIFQIINYIRIFRFTYKLESCENLLQLVTTSNVQGNCPEHSVYTTLFAASQ